MERDGERGMDKSVGDRERLLVSSGMLCQPREGGTPVGNGVQTRQTGDAVSRDQSPPLVEGDGLGGVDTHCAGVRGRLEFAGRGLVVIEVPVVEWSVARGSPTVEEGVTSGEDRHEVTGGRCRRGGSLSRLARRGASFMHGIGSGGSGGRTRRRGGTRAI